MRGVSPGEPSLGPCGPAGLREGPGEWVAEVLAAGRGYAELLLDSPALAVVPVAREGWGKTAEKDSLGASGLKHEQLRWAELAREGRVAHTVAAHAPSESLRSETVRAGRQSGLSTLMIRFRCESVQKNVRRAVLLGRIPFGWNMHAPECACKRACGVERFP